MFGTSYERKDIKSWNSIRDWAIEKGLSKIDASKLNFKLWTDPQSMEKALPMPGSLEVYRDLVNQINEVPIITVRGCNLRDVTVGWFNKHLPEVPESWINMRASNEIKDNDFKIQQLIDKTINWHFDDSFTIVLMAIKNTNTNLFYISSEITPEYINKNSRVTVIPNFEWSPELY